MAMEEPDASAFRLMGEADGWEGFPGDGSEQVLGFDFQILVHHGGRELVRKSIDG